MNEDPFLDDTPPTARKRPASENSFYSMASEQAVLGSMLAHPVEVMPKFSERLKIKDFFVPAHQAIAGVLEYLDLSGMPIEVLTVHAELVERKLDAEVGSPGIIAELLTSFATHLTVDHHISVVLEKVKYRTLLGLPDSIRRKMENGDSMESIVSGVQTVLDDVESNGGGLISSGKGGWSVLYGHIHANVLELRKEWLKTGFTQLDASLNGLRPSRSYVIAARPGIGKTALALNMVRNLCLQNQACGLITMEMDDVDCRLRILSNHASVDTRRIENGCSDAEKLILDAHRSELEAWPIHVLDQSSMTLSDLKKRARQLVHLGCKAIFIDYLQLMHADDPRKKSYDSIPEITRTIKVMARQYKIPFITLVQLNRAEKNADGEPDLENLAGSDAIGRDADAVIILYRDGDGQDFRNVPITWKIAKNRQGPRGKIATRFDGPFVRFTEVGAPA